MKTKNPPWIRHRVDDHRTTALGQKIPKQQIHVLSFLK